MNAKEARYYRKLSQVELAKKCKMSQAEISNIETDKNNATVNTLRRIARALDMQLIVDFVPIRRER